jgi:hypothetical protein
MGADYKERMYITRRDHNLWLFYCHNCSRIGHYAANDKHSLILESTSELVTSPIKSKHYETLDRFELSASPFDSNDEWSLEARLFVDRYRMQEFDPKITSNIYWYGNGGYSKTSVISHAGVIVLPMFDGPHHVHGTQHRKLDIKQFMTKKTDKGSSSYYYPPGSCNNAVVIVEDLISHYRLGSLGYDTIALCGTHLDEFGLDNIKVYKNVMLWLDPDVAGQAGALELFRQINGLPTSITSHMIFKNEPKHLLDETIIDILGAEKHA